MFAEIASRFRYPAYAQLEDGPAELEQARCADRRFASWANRSVANHKMPGYAIVTLSLKPPGGTPGDATAEQMDGIAELADRYSFGEVRVGHAWLRLRDRLESAATAWYLAELADRSLEERHEAEPLYDLLRRATILLTLRSTAATAVAGEGTSQTVTLSVSVMPRRNAW